MLALILASSASAAGGGVKVVYRDATAQSARAEIAAYTDKPPFYTVSHLAPGDVDNRCDGVCHAVVCTCPSNARGAELCRRDMPESCAPSIVPVPIGGEVRLQEGAEASIQLTCRDSSRCRRLATRRP